MQDFKDEQDLLGTDGAEPLAGSGLEDEKADGEFIPAVEEEAEGRES
jgi:hypothetical protein